MELPRLVLPSQRYPAAGSDYYERSRRAATSRQPLGESSGNAQHHNPNLGSMTLCSQGMAALSPLASAIPAPPIVPTQAINSAYGTTANLRLRRHQLQMQRAKRQSINPIYLSPQFHTYRKKQAEKDDKAAQVWPDVLEDAFLDALLLIPQMGRRKYTMRGQQHGRNMLIREYLWVAYCHSLPASVRPDEGMRRTRKQVSSHIQVLKGFFQHHRCFHFFFGKEEKKGDRIKEPQPIETESFKNNLVLIALAESRLPEERPNYEYFAQLLTSDSLVTVRPSKCWIYVAAADVTVREDGFACDSRTGDVFDAAQYPHLPSNLHREDWPERGHRVGGTLLHEYTRSVQQIESASVRQISLDWQENFPELSESLEEIIEENLRDILHFHVTMDVQQARHFPSGSELNSWVEVNIEQANLLNHRWKVVTRLSRPTELCHGEDDALVELSSEMAVQFTHRPGCDDRNAGCDCMNSRRKQEVIVPYPAVAWAGMLGQLASYPKHPYDQRMKVKNEDEDEDSKHGDAKHANQMEIMKKIAMYQELWSCAPEPGHDGRPQTWKRRAAVLWTFETIHSLNEKDEIETRVSGSESWRSAGGTSWRFLTAIDPTSQYHQQQALVSASDSREAVAKLSRDTIMSPTPNYQQQLSGAMSENFSSAWDTAAGVSLPGTHNHHGIGNSMATYGPGAINILEPFSSGLATPPPTAGLHQPYPTNYDVGHHDVGARTLSGYSTTSSTDVEGTLNGDGPAADPYMSATGSMGVVGGYTDTTGCDPSGALQSWDTASLGVEDQFDASQWQTSFLSGGHGHQHQGTMSWNNGSPDGSTTGEISPTASSHWDPLKSHHIHHQPSPQGWMQSVVTPDATGAGANHTWGGGDHQHLHQHQHLTHHGQKRRREESVDDRDAGSYRSAVPRLTHHQTHAYARSHAAGANGVAPQAVMDRRNQDNTW